MAIVLDALATVGSRTVFITPPDFVKQYTTIPRAMVNFSLNEAAISAKPLNDQQELNVSIVLNPTFAYRWVDMEAALSQDVANDWRATAYVELTNALRGLPIGATQRHVMNITDYTRIPAGGTGGGEAWGIRALGSIESLPRYIIQRNLQDPVISFKATNIGTAAGAAGTFSCFFSFWEYEIEQAEAFPLHFAEAMWAR